MVKSIYIASGNTHKVEEFGDLLSGLAIRLHSAERCGGMPPVDESGDTFRANALIKAKALVERVTDGAWVLADDSGLEVVALGGAPGVYSARYAGAGATDAANVGKLLEALAAVDGPQRTARFRCVLCLITDGPKPLYFEGSCEGRIARQAAGESGFGYDPVFIPEGYERSFAQLGESVKHLLSHRARAVAALREAIKAGTVFG